jgi:hypothetical protein
LIRSLTRAETGDTLSWILPLPRGLLDGSSVGVAVCDSSPGTGRAVVGSVLRDSEGADPTGSAVSPSSSPSARTTMTVPSAISTAIATTTPNALNSALRT